MPRAMQKLFSDWDALLGKPNPSTTPGADGPVRITAKAGFHFDNVEHACAYFYEKARVIEAVQRGEALERIAQEPEAFWRREIVPLPNEPLDADPRRAAAVAFRRLAAARHRSLSSELAMGNLEYIQRLVRHSFNPPHSEEIEFVLAMARSLLDFLERIAESGHWAPVVRG